MRLYRKCCTALIMCLILIMSASISVVALEYNTEQSTHPNFQTVFDELAAIHYNNFMFILEAESRGMTAEELLTEKTLNALHNQALMEGFVSPLNVAGDLFWANIPLIQQNRWYNCGPASALQALHGLGHHTSVSGSNDNERMNTLTTNMGTRPGVGTFVYRMVRELNVHSTTFRYQYIYAGGMTEARLRTLLSTSLSFGVAPILHARTQFLSYYNGHISGHYIAVSAINVRTNMVTLRDCNHNNAFHGTFTVPLSEVLASINSGGRFLIVMAGI